MTRSRIMQRGTTLWRQVASVLPMLRDRRLGRASGTSGDDAEVLIPPGYVALEALRAPLCDCPRLVGRISTLTEEVFMGVAETLEKLPAASEELVRHSDRLLVLASGTEHGAAAFDDTLKVLQVPLGFVDRCQTQMCTTLEQIDVSISRIDTILESEDVLHRTISPLAYVKTLFKVESSSLSHDVQQMFQAVTQDIDHLHRKVMVTFSEKFSVLRSTQATLRSLAATLRQGIETQGKALAERRAGVDLALHRLKADLKKNERQKAHLTATSRDIEREVGRLVMVLQTQDIVTQKLAHVQKALGDIRSRWREAMTARHRSEAREHLVFCAVSSRLQSAHATAVAAELGQAAGVLTEASSGIGTRIREMGDDAVCMSDLGSVTASSDGLVQVLFDTMDDVRSMLKNATATNQALYEALRPMGSLTSNLTSIMRELSAQIRLIAINSQIQAAHNGVGTGLEVLSASTATISRETNEVSEGIATAVDRLTADLNLQVDGMLTLVRMGEGISDTSSREFAERETSLHAFRDETLNELMTVGKNVGVVSELSARMKVGEGFQEETERGFRDVCQGLDSICSRILEFLGLDWGSINLDVHDAGLAALYTVASEKSVHRSLFGSKVVGAGGGGMESPDEAHGARAGGSPRSDPDALGPCTDPGAPGCTEPAKTLGDNVELF